MKSRLALAALAMVASAALAPASLAAAPHATSRSSAAPIRAAEARLIAHLEGPDPLAWVRDYTKDAVFQEGEAAPVAGRAALTALARSLGPLSNVRIVPLRTLVSGRLAYVQVRGAYAVGPRDKAAAPERFRGVMIWRKDSDGVWRMLHEMLAKDMRR